MKKRLLSILLTLCMIFSLLPTGVMASETEPAPSCGQTEHTHGEDCYVNEASKTSLGCGLTEHTHTAECYDSPMVPSLNDVAKIEGGESYSSLSDAVAAASAGAKIQLLADDTASGQITINKSLSIELNGHSLPEITFILSSGTISISDSLGTGEINKNSSTYDGIRITGATVTLNNLRVYSGTGNYKAIRIESGSLTVNGGTYTGLGTNGSDAIYVSSGSLTINDGTFRSTIWGCGLSYSGTPAGLKIKKGTFIAGGGQGGFWLGYATVSTKTQVENTFLKDSPGSYVAVAEGVSFDKNNVVIGSNLFISEGFTEPGNGSTSSTTPAQLTPASGDSVTLRPQILGGNGDSSALQYQWSKDNSPITEATNPSYTIDNYDSTTDEGRYSVTVTDAKANSSINVYWQVGESSSATTPQITIGEQSATLTYGLPSMVNYTVTATAFSTAPSSYTVTWYADSSAEKTVSAPSGVTLSTNAAAEISFYHGAMTPVGTYYFTVSSGSTQSSCATMIVGQNEANNTMKADKVVKVRVAAETGSVTAESLGLTMAGVKIKAIKTAPQSHSVLSGDATLVNGALNYAATSVIELGRSEVYVLTIESDGYADFDVNVTFQMAEEDRTLYYSLVQSKFFDNSLLNGTPITISGLSGNGDTITMENVSFSTTAPVAIFFSDCKVKLIGENTITSTFNGDTADQPAGIKSSGGFYIEGTGSLTVTGGTATTTQSSQDISSYGIYCVDTLTVDGCKVTATCGGAKKTSYGISVSGDINVINGGELVGKTIENSTATPETAYGVYASDFNLTAGSLIGQANIGTNKYGVAAYHAFTDNDYHLNGWGTNSYNVPAVIVKGDIATLAAAGDANQAPLAKAKISTYSREMPLTIDTGTASIDKIATEGWKWDKENNTLTLDGLKLNATDSTSDDVTGIKLPDGAKLAVSGTNMITVKNDGISSAYGIYANGALEVSGSGSLNVTATGADNTNSGGMAIYADGNVTIKDTTLTLTGTVGGSQSPAQGYGIMAVGGDVIIDSGSVNISGTGYGIGAAAYGDPVTGGDVTVNGGDVTVNGGTNAIFGTGTITTGTGASVIKKQDTAGAGSDATDFTDAKYVSISFGSAISVGNANYKYGNPTYLVGKQVLYPITLTNVGTITYPGKQISIEGFYSDAKCTTAVDSPLVSGTTGFSVDKMGAPTQIDLRTMDKKGAAAGTYYFKLQLKDNSNQVVATTVGTLVIDKAEYDGTKTLTASPLFNKAAALTLTLPALPTGASYGTPRYAQNDSGLLTNTPSVSGTTLTYAVTSQPKNTVATIVVPVTGAANYKDYDITINAATVGYSQAWVDTTFGKDNASYTAASSNTPQKVTLKNDVTLTAPIEIGENMIINLDGHTITGAAGQDAIITADGKNISISGSGSISGGEGTGNNSGGNAVSGSGNVTVSGNADLKGGSGAGSGNGGSGVQLQGNGSVTVEDGTITGGNGALGGTGVQTENGGIIIREDGTVIGGSAASGGTGGSAITGGGSFPNGTASDGGKGIHANTKIELKPGTPVVTVTEEELIGGAVTDEERKDNTIAKIDIVLTVEQTTHPTDKDAADKAITSGQRMGIYLEIVLEKVLTKASGTEPEIVTSTNAPISITVVIPEGMRGGSNYKIIRVHDGVSTIITPQYDAANYTLTFKTDRFSTYGIAYTPASGSAYNLAMNGIGNAASGSGSYDSGAEVSISAGTKSGYRFSHWSSSNGGSFANAYAANTTFTMPAGDVTVTAHWTSNGGGNDSSDDYYTITATAGTGGTISAGKYVSVREGDSADFTFTPSKGYQVADVLINGKSIGAKNSYTFTDVRSDQTIHVIFEVSNGHTNPQTGIAFEQAKEYSL